ncbi:serine/threonine-protein kinase meng-po isoform X2 [Anopheles arabiensis]|nr:serine/threonine-protein kinase meng-po isoform X2 [Anopheles arabiensis]XP_040162839.1 serine/threonine-protein kinase meng-po isoform X2 [Anopheles arabiensis]XP_040162840.1 serine/threonine-protein kinase meng-po isoform X2 [Anopheles arabiensis]XP_040162841.1 serine/threonine-protein kinase meng-po isoform X2 [Anopheles arabiensis]XP_040162842.1 serine/threonine-protein kinase meng-po isoform X2 [Anopheles arabiensis]
MATSKKSAGSIHKIREFELDKVVLSDEFDILQIVGEGWFGKILLVEHRATDTEMVLKLLPKPFVSLTDFYKEFHFSLMLGQHKNIVTTYDVAFETAGFFVFTQEYAPLGDLTSNVSDNGIGELHTKRVARQLASAIDYIHQKDLIHRDIKLDNVLVFRSDFARIKLCDFGESRKLGEEVLRRNEWLPYSPPEVLLVKTDDKYKSFTNRTDTAHDVWQFGIVCFVCLTGCLPWQKASTDDPRYNRYQQWHQATLTFPMKRCPKLFKLLSARACKLFKKFLDPRSDRRLKTLSDLQKFIDDRWLAKSAEKEMAENEPDELCPSMYSFHSSVEEKNKLLGTLAQCGIETTVDRAAKKNRIRDWIQSSVIVEEEEEDDSGSATPSSTVSRTAVPGHVSSVAAMERAEKKINTTVKEASQKHIDPRTGTVQVGPSEMGSINAHKNNNNRSPPNINGHTILSNSSKPNLLSATHGLVKVAFSSVASVPLPQINRSELANKKINMEDSGYGSINGTHKNRSYSNKISKSPTLPKRSTFIRSENNPSEDMESSEERDSQSLEFDELETDRGSDGFVNALHEKRKSEKRQESTYDKLFFRRK